MCNCILLFNQGQRFQIHSSSKKAFPDQLPFLFLFLRQMQTGKEGFLIPEFHASFLPRSNTPQRSWAPTICSHVQPAEGTERFPVTHLFPIRPLRALLPFLPACNSCRSY